MASLVSEDLRALMGEFYLSGTPLGKRLEGLLPRVEELEGAVPCAPPTPPDWHPYEPDPDATP
jgi:hypothetical protein